MPHATATYNGKAIAKADTWEVVEGNIYVSQLLRPIAACVKLMHDSFRPRQLTFRLRRYAALTFEHSSVDQSFLTKTDTKTECGWKGTASYYTINVDGKKQKRV